MKSKIIITGASGFIGSKLFKELNKRKIASVGLTRQKIKGLKQVSSYSSFKNNQNDVLVHLAQNRNTKIKNKLNEVEDFKNLIKKNWHHIIYISSTNVYGIQSTKHHVTTERVFPSNTYTETKIACEELTRRENGTVLRFSNIYGHNMDQNTIVGTIMKQLNNDGPIVLNETKSVRDFLWIDDAIESILLSIKNKPNSILNVGTGKGTSINELIKVVLQLVNTEKRYIIKNNKNHKNNSILIDISETKKVIKWKPKISLKLGLSKILKRDKII